MRRVLPHLEMIDLPLNRVFGESCMASRSRSCLLIFITRDYVSRHWPNPDVNARQLKSMYDRLVAAEDEIATAGSPANGANGQA